MSATDAPCAPAFLGSRAPEQLVELVGSLQQVVSVLAQQRELLLEQRQQAGRSGGGLVSKTRVPWLLLAAAGYGQALLSKADVAALFLSRKILLTQPAQVSNGPGGVQGNQGRAASWRGRAFISPGLGGCGPAEGTVLRPVGRPSWRQRWWCATRPDLA